MVSLQENIQAAVQKAYGGECETRSLCCVAFTELLGHQGWGSGAEQRFTWLGKQWAHPEVQ